MPLDTDALIETLQGWTLGQWLPFVILLIAIVIWRRAGLVFARMEVQNRKLKKGIRGYARMEQEHVELSQENRERNTFHAELGPLITRLNQERTTRGVCDVLVEFTARILQASEVSIFLVDAGSLLGMSARGVSARALRVKFGEGRIGAIAAFARVFVLDDFRNVDPETRDRLGAGSGAIDTVAGAPLVAHGNVIGVLNVGGTVRATASIHREVLSVVAQLGATTVENQLNFERLEREATTDGLTQLSNVRNFKEKMRQELARAQRYGRELSVFLFDIDNFKHYNDRNGHPAGDECLRQTGALLKKSTRTSDLPARYGGEEFIVLLPETDGDGALAFAEKIRALIAAADYPHREAQPLGCVSISGGVAAYPRDGEDLEALVSAADKALYQAKKSGRNRVLRFGGIAASPASDETRAAG